MAKNPSEGLIFYANKMEDVEKKAVEVTTEAAVKVDPKDLKSAVEEVVAKHLETLEKREKEFNMTGSDEAKAKLDMTKKRNETVKFLNAISLNDVMLLNEYRTKALNETTGGEGGYLVPDEFATDIMRNLNEYSAIRRNATVLPMKTDVKRLNVSTTVPQIRRPAELATITGTTATFAEPVLTAQKYAAYIDWSNELLEDSEIDTLNWITELIAEGMAQAEEYDFVNGTVSGSEGILQVAGTTAITLNSGTAFTNLTWDDMSDMQAALYPVANLEAERGQFYMNYAAYNTLRQSKSSGDGNYLVMPSAPSEQTPALAWGRPIVIVPSFPSTTATATKFVAYADGKRHFVIGDRRGLTLKIGDQASIVDAGGSTRNLFTTDAQVLRVTKRTAFVVRLPNGIVTLATN